MPKPRIPPEVIEEIRLKEPEPIKKIVTLIQDTKHTKQFSVKMPAVIMEEIEWKAGDKIEIEIVDKKTLKLKKAG